MKDTDIERIAEAIAAKIGEPGGAQLLGCGDASSSQNYTCREAASYVCERDYECGGAGEFNCRPYYGGFTCHSGGYFRCYTRFKCEPPHGSFGCHGDYN